MIMARTSQRKPKPGDKIILPKLPPGFIDDLPPEDQVAITEILGKPISLVSYRDDDGYAELEFTEPDGTIHFLYVDPALIKPASARRQPAQKRKRDSSRH
jgi:hypothetical protein